MNPLRTLLSIFPQLLHAFMSQGQFYVYISAGPDLEIRQPFHDSIFGTPQIRQPLQGRRISRVPNIKHLVIQSDLFGMVNWPFKCLGDLQLGNKKSPGMWFSQDVATITWVHVGSFDWILSAMLPENLGINGISWQIYHGCRRIFMYFLFRISKKTRGKYWWVDRVV